MSNISLIVAVDEQGGIGKSQQLLCHLPIDLAFFKAQTLGKPMIMGRRTYEAIGRPLPGRRSIVLSAALINIPGVEIAHSIEEALMLCASAPEVMVIGGGKIYAQFLPLAQRIYMTKIHHKFAADTFFPIIKRNEWTATILRDHPADAKNPYDLTFVCYEKINMPIC